VTIAEALKPEYATALIGKWHLGHVAPFWPPTSQGFDLFFGLPYSHDIKPLSLYESNGPGVELTKEDVDFPQLQARFAARAERFIEEQRDRPFFLELALSAPHLPNYPHPSHAGHSRAGAYGDVVEEVDAIVGRLLAKLAALGIERDTLVVFTSDNGPWFEGSAGNLRQRKGGGGYDGGYRVPFIVRQPAVIPARRKVNSIAMSIDLLPTFCAMAGKDLPAGVTLDGLDISDVLLRGAASPHDELVLFDNEDVVAIRTQRWKYVTNDYYRRSFTELSGRGYPQLYDMSADEAEDYSMAARAPEVLADMQARLERARQTFAPLKSKELPEPWRSTRQDK
jgi:arylsulfatase A-like enzyme